VITHWAYKCKDVTVYQAALQDIHSTVHQSLKIIIKTGIFFLKTTKLADLNTLSTVSTCCSQGELLENGGTYYFFWKHLIIINNK